jgi:hypothetical protein
MTRTAIVCSLSLLMLGASARAQDKPAAGAPPGGMPDMTKMGPASRPVTKEKEDKKGIDELCKSMEDAWKKGDVNAVADNIDFPVIMMSDDSSGAATHYEATRDQWVGMMKPMIEGMPKDTKMSAKRTVTLLSDTLGLVATSATVTMGKNKQKFNDFNVVNYKDGKWKVKQMAQAGWGDIKPPSPSAAANLRK